MHREEDANAMQQCQQTGVLVVQCTCTAINIYLYSLPVVQHIFTSLLVSIVICILAKALRKRLPRSSLVAMLRYSQNLPPFFFAPLGDNGDYWGLAKLIGLDSGDLFLFFQACHLAAKKGHSAGISLEPFEFLLRTAGLQQTIKRTRVAPQENSSHISNWDPPKMRVVALRTRNPRKSRQMNSTSTTNSKSGAVHFAE